MHYFKHSLPILLACLTSSCALLACGDDSSTFNTSNSSKIGDKCKADDECPANAVCKDNICTKKKQSCDSIDCDDDQHCENGKCLDNEEKCGDEVCSDNQTCDHDKCVDLCGNEVCQANELCHEDKCVPSCGGIVCGENEKCVQDKCTKTGDCDSIQCNDNQVCHNGECRDEGECGGVKCEDDETCSQDICRKAGDCAGIKCEDDEICAYDLCLKPGNCGGVTCPDNMLCDIPNDMCRNPGDCGGIDCGEDYYCHQTQCFEKEICGDTRCEGDEECIDDVCVPSEYCLTGKPRCGTECCTAEQFCGTSKHCCTENVACGNDCCTEDQVCDNEKCHIACADNIERCAAEDGTEVCCQEGEICTSYRCFLPKVSCVDDYQCDDGEYCESTQKKCLPEPPGKVCEAKPTGGKVVPTVLWHWGVGDLAPETFPSDIKVMSATMVADVDLDGQPEVVFNSWSGAYVGGGILRIVDGKTGKTKYSSNGNPRTDGGGMTAIGDIIKDDAHPGLEIVTCVCTIGNCGVENAAGLKIALYNNKAEQIWVSNAGNFTECGQSGPSIVDFDGDGNPEIFSRYNIYNGQTGEMIARIPCGDSAYWHQACDYSTAADIDGDGLPELIGGSAAYKVDVKNKTITKLFENPHGDGYPAVGDLDLDGDPEIVVVRPSANTLMAYRKDYTNYWPAPVSHTAYSGGTPTIANIDSTPEPEITFAGKDAYIAFNHDGTIKWQQKTHDFSSARTGSSVFDFDGDGKAEVVYADECFFRVYDGEKGDVRFCEYNTNGTHYEYPVIADINNDNHAEVLVGATPYDCSDLDENHGIDDCTRPLIAQGVLKNSLSGLRAFSSPDKDWVNTRKIYNQHAYSITNVSDDGTIPVKMRNNWKVKNLNNFRLNVQPGATYLPDLEIKDITSPRKCTPETPIYFNVTNVGWAAADPGITVHVWASAEETGDYIDIGTVKTTRLLKATEYEALQFKVPLDAVASEIIYLKLTFDETAPTECRLDNNDASYSLNCTTVN